MKRWICVVISLIMTIYTITSTETVLAEIYFTDDLGRATNTSINDTFPTVDGRTVSLREDASKDVTILIFGQTICGNTELLLQSIAKSGWIHEPNVKVIFAETSKANEAVTRHFVNRYGCEEITACYSVTGGISELMWNYIGTGGSVSTPVVVLLDRNGNVQEILQACYSANDLYQAMRKFAEINGSESDAKPDQERTLSVSGEENYEDADKVLELVNQARALEGAGEVRLDAELMETAMIRAAELSLYYAHVSPCGKECFSIFRSSARKGENIAVGQKMAQQVMFDWLNSKGHHANIVNPVFTSVGIGCFTDNNGTKYWVQCFDSAEAVESEKYGVHKVQRSVQILESHIHLEAVNKVFTIGCAEKVENVKIDIRNINETYEDSAPSIQPSDLLYSSSNPQAAEADENGTITVNGTGSTVITASLKTAPDINVKLNLTKMEHSYVKAPGSSGTEEEKYVCENCGGIWGEEAGIGKAEIDANISVSSEKSAVKIIDSRTKEPISLARVWVNGESWTDKNGIVQLSQTGLTELRIEKEGYHKKTVKKELKKEEVVPVMLCRNTGDLQVVSATLNLVGEYRDVMDHTVTVFDKDLDGETDIIDTDFTLNIESAGSPVKYELIQNGRVLKTSTDGEFILPGHYSNSKKKTVSYYLDELSAGYEVTVRITDNKGKKKSKKIGIKVAKGSSSVYKTLKKLEEEENSKAKVEFGKKVSMTIPSDIPIMGGTELEFGLEDKLPIQVSFDTETGLVRVALNMDDEDPPKWDKRRKEFENLKNKAAARQKMGNAFGGVPEPFGAGMFSVKGEIMGYGEGYLLDNTDSLRVNLGVVVSINAEKNYTYYCFLPGIIIPVYVSFGGGVSCNVSGGVNLEFADSKMLINGGTLEFQPSIYAKPEAGVGIDGVMSFSAYGKIEFAWLYRYLNNYSQVTLSGTAKLKKELFWRTKEWDLWNGTKVISDSNKRNAFKAGQKVDSNADYLDMSDSEPISMEYLSKRERAIDNTGFSGNLLENAVHSGSVRLLAYAYENASPKLIQAGNKQYLFYLDGVNGRSEQNQTALFYRTSSDDGTTWSEAMRADNGINETADYNFDIVVTGNEIYAIWSDAGKVYGDEILAMDSNAAITKTGKEMDLMISVIDSGTGNVRRTFSLGTGNADLQPKIAVGSDGTVYAAWITNDASSENGLLSNENRMGICYASSKDNYTVHEKPLSESFYPLSLDIGMLGQEMCIAASLDIDADLNTQEDREIYMMRLSTGGKLEAQTLNDQVDSIPVFGQTSGENYLFWYQNGNIAYTLDGENIDFVFKEENTASIGQEFSLLESENGRAAVVWSSTSLTKEKGVDVYCSDFNGTDWSDAYCLGELDSQYTGRLSGYLDTSGYRMVYLGSIYEEDELFSHICMYTPKERIDTSILWETKENGALEDTYPLNLTVINNGNKTVERLSIVSEDGSIQDEITGISIAPGTSMDLVWDKIRLPEEMTETYKFNLKVKAEEETDLTDNMISLSVGEPDFSVEVYQDFSSGDQFAGIVVTNNGMVSSDAVLSVYKDEKHTEKLYETIMPQLQGGETRIALLDLTILSSKTPMFYFVVTDDRNMETYEEDNQTALYIARGVYLDYENDSDMNGENTEPPLNHEKELNKSGNMLSASIVKKPPVSTVKSFKAKAGRKRLILSWKKLPGVSGYQIQISTRKNFKRAKTTPISKARKSYIKKNLKEKKKYYIRIRAYKVYKNPQDKKLRSYGKWKKISKKTK